VPGAWRPGARFAQVRLQCFAHLAQLPAELVSLAVLTSLSNLGARAAVGGRRKLSRKPSNRGGSGGEAPSPSSPSPSSSALSSSPANGSARELLVDAQAEV
jgi:hypothetical protein